MGLWLETCFVTRTPIEIGDSVVMVVPTAMAISSQRTTLFDSWQDVTESVDWIDRGVYDGYGWLQSNHSDQDRGDRPGMTIFAHADVWDAIVAADVASQPTIEEMKAIAFRIVSREFPSRFWPFALEWRKIRRFCRRCRIDPLGSLPFKGQQDSDVKSFALLSSLTAARHKIWFDYEMEDDGS